MNTNYNVSYGYDAANAEALVGGAFVVMIITWVISIGVSILMLVSMWKIFKKFGKPGWAAIIPIYNIYVMCEIAEKPWWYILLLCVPIANVYVMFVLYDAQSKKLGKDTSYTIGMLLLPIIFIPLLAFDKTSNKDVIEDNNSVESNEQNEEITPTNSDFSVPTNNDSYTAPVFDNVQTGSVNNVSEQMNNDFVQPIEDSQVQIPATQEPITNNFTMNEEPVVNNQVQNIEPQEQAVNNVNYQANNSFAQPINVSEQMETNPVVSEPNTAPFEANQEPVVNTANMMQENIAQPINEPFEQMVQQTPTSESVVTESNQTQVFDQQPITEENIQQASVMPNVQAQVDQMPDINQQVQNEVSNFNETENVSEVNNNENNNTSDNPDVHKSMWTTHNNESNSGM